jgi:small glutamine-rich tetratricopeptide repeat-containing protein alpha
MNRGYQTASKKYREQGEDLPSETTRDASSTNTAAPSARAGGMPDLSSLLGAFGGGGASAGGAGGAGGGPDLAGLLNNPMLMNMAQQMASSGALNDIMNNPRMREMAQQMMSGERNIGDLMSDPDVQNM